ncbi:hypothetical protein J6590_045350 [Homalodisca vitripennis]|nr:hypothetical protein J6590_045350 [Homalodisca vitripennis]
MPLLQPITVATAPARQYGSAVLISRKSNSRGLQLPKLTRGSQAMNHHGRVEDEVSEKASMTQGHHYLDLGNITSLHWWHWLLLDHY